MIIEGARLPTIIVSGLVVALALLALVGVQRSHWASKNALSWAVLVPLLIGLVLLVAAIRSVPR